MSSVFHPAPERLDRLSALLLAVAPRVTVHGAHAQGHTLCVQLLSLPGQAPHSIAVGPGPCGQGPSPSLESAQDGPPVSGPPVSMQVLLEGPAAPMLMREFDPPLVLPLASADPALRHAVQLLCSELNAPRCGQPAMLASVGHMLFIGLLRHLVAHPLASGGLFAGLNDPRIAASLVAMHEEPQGAWTLESLAERAGMSRTAFATRFKDSVRTSPGKYLSQLRLLIAQRAVQSGKSLKSAARESGYLNASALSRALAKARPHRAAPERTPVNAPARPRPGTSTAGPG
ncbi:helix-turn-helix domain-containing protein [Paracidovorax sp. MALMAid1276]|uniref:helix-turn-helix domain-containing protein n=1 Tax=Paracidovorax sp. MALMAid1276 TaxID=3411631 RepID=UPI003B9DA6E3